MIFATDLGRKAYDIAESSSFTFDMSRAYFEKMSIDEVFDLMCEFRRWISDDAVSLGDKMTYHTAARICQMELAQRAEENAYKIGDTVIVGRSKRPLKVVGVERTYTGDRVYVVTSLYGVETYHVPAENVIDGWRA